MGKKKKNKEVEVIKPEDNSNEPKENEENPNKKINFKIYKFIIKIIAVALLIALGVFLLVGGKYASMVLIFATAAIAIVGVIIRIYPLFKKDMSKEAKYVSLGEMVTHLLIGAFLILCGVCICINLQNAENGNEESHFCLTMQDFIFVSYTYFVAGLLYTRALSYFWQTVLCKEKATRFTFWIHIAIITIAVVFAAFGRNLDMRTVCIILAVISFIVALVIGGEAGGGYYKYRKMISPKKDKEEKKEEPVENPIEAPTDETNKDKEIEDDIPVIEPVEEPVNETNDIPVIDPNAIPDDKNDQDTPIVS